MKKEHENKKMKIWVISQNDAMVDYCLNEKEAQIREENIKRKGISISFLACF
jgi:hypothetical protein